MGPKPRKLRKRRKVPVTRFAVAGTFCTNGTSRSDGELAGLVHFVMRLWRASSVLAPKQGGLSIRFRHVRANGRYTWNWSRGREILITVLSDAFFPGDHSEQRIKGTDFGVTMICHTWAESVVAILTHELFHVFGVGGLPESPQGERTCEFAALVAIAAFRDYPGGLAALEAEVEAGLVKATSVNI